MTTKRYHTKIIGPLIGLFLFSAALWVLYHELHTYHLKTLLHSWRSLPPAKLVSGFFLTLLSYTVLTGYDTLALRFIKKPLAYRKTALVSFIGYAFSNNIGFSMLTGASVRYRLYSGWGLSTFEIANIIGFCALTVWIGFMSLAGIAFTLFPMALPKALHLPFASARPLGFLLLGVVAVIVVIGVIQKKPIRIREWEFKFPAPTIFTLQVMVSATDWAVAASVLYVLLPDTGGLTYFGFVGIFLLAQLAGLASQVPGGLGIFETIIVILLPSQMPTAAIIASLLAYRALYYLLPLVLAAMLMGAQEILQKKTLLGHFTLLYNRWFSGILPIFLSIATFVAGAILLFSGATPADHYRLLRLKEFLPLPFIEISHFMGSIAGMGLLLLARGLQRRLDASYILAVGLLVSGIIASLLKGLDYEEAIVLAVILLAILPSRSHYYRKASLLSLDLNAGWITAILIVLIGSVWLGLFSFKHLEYSDSLWWRFTFFGDAPRFLRATVGAVGLAVMFAAARLLLPAVPKADPDAAVDLSVISAIVEKSPDTSANLALLGNKHFLLNERENAFIMYGIEGRSWIAMGDPVGPDAERADLAWRFRELSDRYDGWTVFYEVRPALLHIYLDIGLTLIKLGEEARVPLPAFTLEGSKKKGLRHTVNRLLKEDCHFEVVQPPDVPALVPDLKNISDAWLKEKKTREKGFSLGYFNPDYIRRFSIATIRQNGKLLAFANIWPGAGKEEISIDLMRYLPGAPAGIMDYLLISLIRMGQEQGYLWFNLGMAPLSGFDARALAPFWNRLGLLLNRYGGPFYNFQGLRRYKDKFDPVWTPKYLASPGGLALPRILVNLATLISGGISGVVTK